MKLVRDAWNDFKERFRYRVMFDIESLKYPEVEDAPFDLDYYIPKKDRKPFEGDIPSYLELGLTKGDEYVDAFERNVMPTLISDNRLNRLVQINELREYLEKNEYLVSITDKNLGVAVVTKKWLIENTTKLWNDPLNYRKLNALEREEQLTRKINAVKSCAKLAQELGNEQLEKFLLSKVPAKETDESAVPVLYGIPKVHKLPVKVRPIVPCHSNAQSPAAVYVSKLLKPLVAERPYVIQGSKDLSIKLKELSLHRHRKAWIVSGDVVAFYPNIPLNKCLELVLDWCKSTILSDKSVEERRLFTSCFMCANRGLVIDFNGETAEQIKGLAMGIACSPDLANLYGAHFEEQFMSRPDIASRVPFYGRYLDDVLALVYADTAAEAKGIMQGLVFDECEIGWEVSEYHTPFLDLLVYLDPADGSVQHKPYKKPMNHR